MSLTKLTTNLNNISSLPDKPSLQADELKQEFDKAGNSIKEYINDTLLDEIEELVESEKITVENTLTSTSTTKALSSYQGNLLKESITKLDSNKQDNISTGTSEPSGGSDGDIYLQYFS